MQEHDAARSELGDDVGGNRGRVPGLPVVGLDVPADQVEARIASPLGRVAVILPIRRTQMGHWLLADVLEQVLGVDHLAAPSDFVKSDQGKVVPGVHTEKVARFGDPLC